MAVTEYGALQARLTRVWVDHLDAMDCIVNDEAIQMNASTTHGSRKLVYSDHRQQ